MAEFDSESCSEAECVAELDRLFPHGFAGPDVLDEIAQEGWERSPLRAVFHPSPEQVYEEALQLHRNLQELRRPDDQRPLPPEPGISSKRVTRAGNSLSTISIGVIWRLARCTLTPDSPSWPWLPP